MIDKLDRLVGAVQEGKISRRDAVKQLGLLMIAAGVTRAEDAPSSTFRARGLNHIALSVTDVPRSRDFYVEHLGLAVTSQAEEQNCFLSCGPDNFVALFQGRPAGMHHYCYTIDDYEPGRVVETLKAADLKPSRQDNRVYFDDPDGLTVQVSAP